MTDADNAGNAEREREFGPVVDDALVDAMLRASSEDEPARNRTRLEAVMHAVRGAGIPQPRPSRNRAQRRRWFVGSLASLASAAVLVLAVLLVPEPEAGADSMLARAAVRAGEAGPLTDEGYTAPDGELPVNVSGGSLGMGDLIEANGLARALEVVLQLRGQAGARQLDDVEVGVAQAWRGVPTTSAAVAVFGS